MKTENPRFLQAVVHGDTHTSGRIALRSGEREREVNYYTNELAKGIQNPPDIDFYQIWQNSKNGQPAGYVERSSK